LSAALVASDSEPTNVENNLLVGELLEATQEVARAERWLLGLVLWAPHIQQYRTTLSAFSIRQQRPWGSLTVSKLHDSKESHVARSTQGALAWCAGDYDRARLLSAQALDANPGDRNAQAVLLLTANAADATIHLPQPDARSPLTPALEQALRERVNRVLGTSLPSERQIPRALCTP
jgi:hypothetical protein